MFPRPTGHYHDDSAANALRRTRHLAVDRLVGRVRELFDQVVVIQREIDHVREWAEASGPRLSFLTGRGFDRGETLTRSIASAVEAANQMANRAGPAELPACAQALLDFQVKVRGLEEARYESPEDITAAELRLAQDLEVLQGNVLKVIEPEQAALLKLRERVSSLDQVITELETAYRSLDSAGFALAAGETLVAFYEVGYLDSQGRHQRGHLTITTLSLHLEAIRAGFLERVWKAFKGQEPRRTVLKTVPIPDVTGLFTEGCSRGPGRAHVIMEVTAPGAGIGLCALRDAGARVLKRIAVLRPDLPPAAPRPALSPT